METKIIKILIIIIIIASIGANIWYFGIQRLFLRSYQKGINEAVISISNQVRNNGQVVLPVFKLKDGLWIQDPEIGEIMLVPKINQEIEITQ